MRLPPISLGQGYVARTMLTMDLSVQMQYDCALGKKDKSKPVDMNYDRLRADLRVPLAYANIKEMARANSLHVLLSCHTCLELSLID